MFLELSFKWTVWIVGGGVLDISLILDPEKEICKQSTLGSSPEASQ